MKNWAQFSAKLLALAGAILGCMVLTGNCQTTGDLVDTDRMSGHRGCASYIDSAVLKIDTVSDTLRPYAAPDLDLLLDSSRAVSWYLMDTSRTSTHLILSGVYSAGHYRVYLRTELITCYLSFKSGDRAVPCISRLMIDDALIEQKVWSIR